MSRPTSKSSSRRANSGLPATPPPGPRILDDPFTGRFCLLVTDAWPAEIAAVMADSATFETYLTHGLLIKREGTPQ